MKALITILCLVTTWSLAQEPEVAPPSEDAPAIAPAAEAPVESANAVPEPYRDDRYQATWAKNPFLIKVGPIINPTASFSEDWELKGIFERGGVQTALLGSKKDPSSFKRVGPNPDAEGFQLVKASPSRNRKDAKVEVSKGGETATFTFSETPTTPQTPRPGIVPGQPPRVPVPNLPQQRMTNTAISPQPQPLPGAVPAAPPTALQRRRVLIPSPVPAAPQQ